MTTEPNADYRQHVESGYFTRFHPLNYGRKLSVSEEVRLIEEGFDRDVSIRIVSPSLYMVVAIMEICVSYYEYVFSDDGGHFTIKTLGQILPQNLKLILDNKQLFESVLPIEA